MSSHTKMLTDMVANGANVAMVVQVACTIITNLEHNLTDARKKQERAYALPAEWTLPDEGRSYALGLGWSGDRVDREAERFHNWAQASGHRKIDWLATWRNWCTSPYHNRAQPSAQRNGGDLTIADRKFLRQEKMQDALEQLHLFAARDKGNGGGAG